MLIPRRTKYRKAHKGRIKNTASRGTQLAFGRFGLQALTPERINSRQIEAARRAMTRYVKRGGNIWIRIFPDIPVTKKPNEVRMGGGKGSPEMYVHRVRAGTVLFEMDGVTEEIAREAMRLASHKVPVKTRFISSGDKEETE